ncbi:MAG: hypothetical protein HYV13_02815 [Candidatus Doudnabacteria bacterium]|nr:hypothetical protein [Candidatus Doudnabacteria bacterium]
MFNKFWVWYQRHYLLNLSVATGLFLLQIFHLYWMLTDVVLLKLTGQSYFGLSDIWGIISTFIDYSEIPAIISTSILYIHLLRERWTAKNFLYLLFLNVQWIHILWITDEVVIERFATHIELFHWPLIAAWVAILIDYLELPVIWDTSKRLATEIRTQLHK